MHYPKVLERVDFPEQIFHRSFSLGAPEIWDCIPRPQNYVDFKTFTITAEILANFYRAKKF